MTDRRNNRTLRHCSEEQQRNSNLRAAAPLRPTNLFTLPLEPNFEIQLVVDIALPLGNVQREQVECHGKPPASLNNRVHKISDPQAWFVATKVSLHPDSL